MKILWTKNYNLDFPGKKFNLYITNYDNTNYLGEIFYYTRKGDWSSTENLISLKFESEQLIALNEDNVYNQCINWINKNLGKDYDILLSETKYF